MFSQVTPELHGSVPALQQMPELQPKMSQRVFGLRQTPPAQAGALAGQTRPHAPQLLGSDWKLDAATQRPPQLTKPGLQTKPQVPLVHVALAFAGAVQILPQAPQLAVVVRGVQAPPQQP